MNQNKVLDGLIGLAVGDALGVPVEFISGSVLKQNPVTEMTGWGTHNQPVGTWSDDSSMAFCLAEMLCTGYDLKVLAQKFIGWYRDAYWTPHGKVFDIGIATSNAIRNLISGTNPLVSGGVREMDNGNGSLMRILPLAFYLKNKLVEERFKLISEVSSVTHGHIRSVMACFIYIEMVLQLLAGKEKFQAYEDTRKTVIDFFREYEISDIEQHKFHRLLVLPFMDYPVKPIYEYEEHEIYGSGYVLHTLEASFWCLLTTDTYKEAVLKAVNLGEDTDTTGAVTGGLAGIYYGTDAIPAKWIEVLARKEDIIDLANRLNSNLC